LEFQRKFNNPVRACARACVCVILLRVSSLRTKLCLTRLSTERTFRKEAFHLAANYYSNICLRKKAQKLSIIVARLCSENRICICLQEAEILTTKQWRLIESRI
jgi:hypothetical protein